MMLMVIATICNVNNNNGDGDNERGNHDGSVGNGEDACKMMIMFNESNANRIFFTRLTSSQLCETQHPCCIPDSIALLEAAGGSANLARTPQLSTVCEGNAPSTSLRVILKR